MASAQVQRSETRDQAIRRLATVAEQRGVQVFHYAPTGEYYAPSQSQPGTLHRLTLWSCDCRGFARHQRCTHYAAMLALTGNLPTEPTPPTPVVVRVPEAPCLGCNGDGWWYGSDRDTSYTTISCAVCQGTGVALNTLIAA